MKCHLICKRDEGELLGRNIIQHKTEKFVYMCGYWVLTDEEREKLENGIVYFHQTKSDPSYFGGEILEIIPQTLSKEYENEYYSFEDSHNPNTKIMNRFIFKIKFDRKYMGVDWEGRDHSMSYFSGVIEE